MKRAFYLLLLFCLVSAPVQADDKDNEKKDAAKSAKKEEAKPAPVMKKGELTDPVEILKKADAACKKVKTVSYDITIKLEVPGQPKVAPFRGSAILSGFEYGVPKMSRIEVHAPDATGKGTRHLTGGSDGELYYVIDHKAKKAYEDMDPKVVGKFARALAAPIMVEFLVESPFGDEIKGKKKELKGSKVVEGVDCYEVYVVYATPRFAAATWCFSKKDFLPRSRVDEFKMAEGKKGYQHKTLSKVVPDPKLKKDAFKLDLPKGYTKTDDFAE